MIKAVTQALRRESEEKTEEGESQKSNVIKRERARRDETKEERKGSVTLASQNGEARAGMVRKAGAINRQHYREGFKKDAMSSKNAEG